MGIIQSRVGASLSTLMTVTTILCALGKPGKTGDVSSEASDMGPAGSTSLAWLLAFAMYSVRDSAQAV